MKRAYLYSAIAVLVATNLATGGVCWLAAYSNGLHDERIYWQDRENEWRVQSARLIRDICGQHVDESELPSEPTR